MDPILLPLVVSPGGADAVGAMMAKAPPGESPPDIDGSFLQLLLRAFPKGLPWELAPQADGTQSLRPSEPAKNASAPEEKSEEKTAEPQDMALQLVALLFAAQQPVMTVDGVSLPVEQVEATTVPLQLTVAKPDLVGLALPVLAAEDIPAPAKEAGNPTPAVPLDLRPPPPPKVLVETDQVLQELPPVIPAPEVREGSFKTEIAPHAASTRGEAEPRVVTGKPMVSVNPQTIPSSDMLAEIITPAPKEPPKQVNATQPSGVEPAKAEGVRPRFVFSAPLVSMLEALTPDDAPKAEPASKIMQPEMPVRPEGTVQQIVERPQVLVEHVEFAAASTPRSEQNPKKAERSPDSVREPAPPVDRPANAGDGERKLPDVRFEQVAPVHVMAEPAHEHTEPQARQPELQTVHTTQNEHPAVVQPEQQASREQMTALHAHVQADRISPIRMRVNTPEVVGTQVRTLLTEELARNVMDQVVKQVSLQVRNDTSEMRMRLDPPTLGEVQLTVRVEQGKMQAQIDVSQPSVKAVLESNMPQLRQSLTDRGIEVQRIDIFTSGESLTKHPQDGRGDRPHRRETSRSQSSLDGVDQYRASRQLGYNTIEVVM